MKKNIKKPLIMIIAPYYFPHIGGVENYILNLVKEFRKKYNWKIIIVTTNQARYKSEVEESNGIKIYRLPVLFKICNTPFNPLWFIQLKYIIGHEKPDIINAHAPVPFMADIAAFVSGSTPFILTYHAGTMKKNSTIYDVLISIYEKLFLAKTFNRADKIICSSGFVRKSIAKDYLDRSVIITPGVDTSLFKPGKKIANNKKKSSIIFIGRFAKMYRMKGLYTVFKAMKKLPNVTLKVVGEKINLEQKNVEFLGIKTGTKLVEEIQKANILILTSKAHMESFGMVLIEAMACKIPVIGTRIGGIPEVINHKVDGLVIPPDNTNALVHAISALIYNPQKAKKMGENGYKKVKVKFLWGKKAQETREIYLAALHA